LLGVGSINSVVAITVIPRVWAFVGTVVVGFIMTWRSMVLLDSSVEGVIILLSRMFFGVGIEIRRVGLFAIWYRRGFIFSIVHTSEACCAVASTAASTSTTGWESSTTTSRVSATLVSLTVAWSRR